MTDTFYLGRRYDLSSKKLLPDRINYDPSDLTTHAVVTGMTGSGKTGLCIALMEEAALQNIPAIIVDIKGDLTNLLLHFPNLAPQDFQPWLDADTVRRQGKALEQAASETAEQWKQGLADWEINQERLRALSTAAQYAVYTPGSDAGLGVSVMSSLDAPSIPWEGNREILREKISSTATALLGLVGVDDVDPVRSREHILLSNIFENAWSKGKSLDLTELILQVQTPPFAKLGAFPVDNFFPEKDRGELAMMLNNILASPTFESWREGQPLDIASFLYDEQSRPRHSIFYVAHLNDTERMFFVTLLLSAVETWMRTQTGSASLRALVYFDELFGYLPPQVNPPSKNILLRMLKQARAFGVGLLLATQNPVDVDYKALSNAGTWFIGKLQTERDKERLLDGLQSASADLDRNAYAQLITSLGKRVFIMHNVHAHEPQIFQTRWAMNFLAGPMTRTQIPALNKLVGAHEMKMTPRVPAASAESSAPETTLVSGVYAESDAPQPVAAATFIATPQPRSALLSSSSDSSVTKPNLPAAVAEFFLPMAYGLTEAFKAAGETMSPEAKLTGTLYRPALLAVAHVRLLDRKHGVDSEMVRAALVDAPDKRGMIRWDDYASASAAFDQLDSTPAPQARFVTPEPPFTEAKLMATLQKDFADWAYRTTSAKARANEALKVYAGPDVSPAEFRTACGDAARAARDAEIAKATAQFDRQIKTLEEKLAREERELRQDEAEYNQRKMEETGTHIENITGLFGGKRSARRLSSSLTKRRQTEQAKADVEESVDSIQDYQAQLKKLNQAREEAMQTINDKWAQVVNDVTEITVTPKKTDVFVQSFGVAWLPFYQMDLDGEAFELPAFKTE